MSSRKVTTPRVKNMQRIAIPSTLPPPPPCTDIPPSYDNIPSTSPKLKCPPTKKTCRSNTIIKGQVGTKFFSLDQLRPYTELLDGCSLIISSCQKPLLHEQVNTKFLLLDAFGMKWTAPRVVDVWREQVDKGLVEDELKTHQVALVRSGSDFFLAHSDKKTKYTQVIHSIIPQISSDSEEEDPFPPASNEDEDDSDFQPNKK